VRRKLSARSFRGSVDGVSEPTRYELIYGVVRRIPRGRVATYGQVATLAGLGGHARLVGYALNVLPDGTRLPWHRVINARGMVSPRSWPDDTDQRTRLEAEGVTFDTHDRVDLNRYRWQPRTSAPR